MPSPSRSSIRTLGSLVSSVGKAVKDRKSDHSPLSERSCENRLWRDRAPRGQDGRRRPRSSSARLPRWAAAEGRRATARAGRSEHRRPVRIGPVGSAVLRRYSQAPSCSLRMPAAPSPSRSTHRTGRCRRRWRRRRGRNLGGFHWHARRLPRHPASAGNQLNRGEDNDPGSDRAAARLAVLVPRLGHCGKVSGNRILVIPEVHGAGVIVVPPPISWGSGGSSARGGRAGRCALRNPAVGGERVRPGRPVPPPAAMVTLAKRSLLAGGSECNAPRRNRRRLDIQSVSDIGFDRRPFASRLDERLPLEHAA